MNIYLATDDPCGPVSRELASKLRGAGHLVDLPGLYQPAEVSIAEMRKSLTTDSAMATAFARLSTIQWADTVVLIGPASADILIEFGLAVAKGKRTIALLAAPTPAALGYIYCDMICDSIEETVFVLGKLWK